MAPITRYQTRALAPPPAPRRPPSTFLTLPPELRILIYRELLLFPALIHTQYVRHEKNLPGTNICKRRLLGPLKYCIYGHPAYVNILRVCKLIHHEAAGVLYGENRWLHYQTGPPAGTLEPIGLANRKRIRHLVIVCTAKKSQLLTARQHSQSPMYKDFWKPIFEGLAKLWILVERPRDPKAVVVPLGWAMEENFRKVLKVTGWWVGAETRVTIGADIRKLGHRNDDCYVSRTCTRRSDGSIVDLEKYYDWSFDDRHKEEWETPWKHAALNSLVAVVMDHLPERVALAASETSKLNGVWFDISVPCLQARRTLVDEHMETEHWVGITRP